MNKLLIGVLVFLLVMAVIGALRGFAKMILSIAVVVVSAVLVWLAAPYAKSFVLEKTDFRDKLAVKTTETLHGMIESDDSFLQRLEELPLTEKSREVLTNSKDALDQKIAALGELLADTILSAALYLLLFLVIYLILRVIAYMIERAADSDGLKFINRAAGSIFALLEGVLILDVAAIALILFAGSDFGVKAYGLIFSDPTLTWAYDHNLLLMMVNKLAESKN